MTKKKICFVIQNLNIGGAQRIFIHLINSLSEKKIYEIKLIIISNRYNDLIDQVNKNIEILFLNKRKAIFSFNSIIKKLNEIKPETVITTITNLNILLCLSKFFIKYNFKLLIREANILSLNSKKDYYYLKLILVRFLYKFSDKIICISKAVQNDLVYNYGIKINQTIVIYNPIDLKFIEEKINDNNQINKVNKFLSNKLISNKKIILSVGKLSPQKGFDLLIESMKYIKNNNYVLFIIGNGKKSLYNKLISNYKLYNRVFIIDSDTNPYVLMKYSSVYICSSRYEGFGNTILEALSLGLPIISTPCHNGTNEIIEDNKYCEVLPNFHPKTMAKAINNKILKNNFKKYKHNLDRYEIKNIIKLYEEVL